MPDENLTKNAQKEFELVNIVEEKVKQKVYELIRDIDMCKCDNCMLNACAIALNALPAHYVTTKKGALLAEIPAVSPDFQTKVTVEVMKALLIVKSHPLH